GECRVGVQVCRGDRPCTEFPQPSGGNHGRVVRRQLKTWHKCRNLAELAVELQLGAQPAIGRDAARNPDASCLKPSRGVEHTLDEEPDHDALETCADIGNLAIGKQWLCRPGRNRFARPDVAKISYFQPAEAEIEIAL